MKATKKRSVYSYQVAVFRIADDGSAASKQEIFMQALSYDPSNEVATLLNVKPVAKPAKEGKSVQ